MEKLQHCFVTQRQKKSLFGNYIKKPSFYTCFLTMKKNSIFPCFCWQKNICLFLAMNEWKKYLEQRETDHSCQSLSETNVPWNWNCHPIKSFDRKLSSIEKSAITSTKQKVLIYRLQPLKVPCHIIRLREKRMNRMEMAKPQTDSIFLQNLKFAILFGSYTWWKAELCR